MVFQGLLAEIVIDFNKILIYLFFSIIAVITLFFAEYISRFKQTDQPHLEKWTFSPGNILGVAK